jgi:predicted DNA-binding transcriptional regulator AlpA
MPGVSTPAQLEQLDHRARAAIDRAGGLLTHQDIAELVGITSRRLHMLISGEDPSFPPPLAQLPGKRNVWTRAAIEAWLLRSGRR